MKHVNYETARALAEMGYDGDCDRWFGRDGREKSTHLVDDDIPAPRLDDAAYWLRDRHGINIYISWGDFSQNWVAHAQDMMADRSWPSIFRKDFDESLEAALNCAITNLKQMAL